MSPLWMRIFTLVGMALAAASMQMLGRWRTWWRSDVPRVRAAAAGPAARATAEPWRSR